MGILGTVHAHSDPAHPGDRGRWQPLEDHLSAVARLSAEFARGFDSEDWGWNAGQLCDISTAAHTPSHVYSIQGAACPKGSSVGVRGRAAR